MNNQSRLLFRKLKQLLKLDFDACRRRAGQEHIYAYAVVMATHGGETLQPWCHSEERHERMTEKNAAYSTEAFYIRYSPDEWDSIVSDLVNDETVKKDWDSTMEQLWELPLGDDSMSLVNLLSDALRELDADGYFGTGDDRNNSIIMVYCNDCADDDWWHNSIGQLNPESVTKKFRDSFSSTTTFQRRESLRKLMQDDD